MKGFFGYASNAHGYRVFNKTSSCVEIACDVTFDESNGPKGEQVDDVVGLEESSSKAIKMLAIGEIKPQEQENQDEDEMVFPSTSRTHSAAHSGNSEKQARDSGSQIRSNRKEDRSIRDMDQEPPSDHQDQPQVEEEAQQVQQQTQVPHPRVHQSIQKDHLVDNILEA